ncbi:uracil-xanthine permease family protein [Winogradskyella sp.]|uniref:uracil-xanthine permease family protein n=1 Tax=Winogradskyella sp. TaxID=1883156 RepID=UPI003BA92F95
MAELHYKIEDRPPFKKAIVYAFQHILTMLGGTVAVPAIIASQLGLTAGETALLISNVLLAMGIATALQSYFGNKLPIIQGSSFAFIPSILLIISQGHETPKDALQYIMGAIILGSLFQVIIGFLGLAGRIQRLLTPTVIGPVVMMIGLSVFSVATSQASTYWPIAIFTIVLIFFFSYGKPFSNPKKRFYIISSLSILTSILIAYFLSVLLSVLGVFHEEHPATIPLHNLNFDVLRSSFPFFTWGTPKFSFTYTLIIIIAYFVSTFESLGDYNAVAEIAEYEDEETGSTKLSDKKINRGILFEGIGCFIAGLIGANPTTSYSENIGLIGISKVASRKITFLGGLLLIVLGLIPFFGSFLSTISTPIMGGLYCVLFGMIIGIGVKITAKSDLTDMRNVSIIGFTLLMAFGIPEYINAPETQKALFNYSETLKDIISGIFGSQMAVAAFFGLLLDSLIPRLKT